MKLERLGTLATWFFGKHGLTYLMIAKDRPERAVQEDLPTWDRKWTEVDQDGKTLGRRILERFWAEDR